MKISLGSFQALGRALMLPIAVLPVAGLLLRLGQPDIAALIHVDLGFIGGAGQAIFDNLGLLFALGVAVGFARENHGAAALAGAVCYLVTTKGAETLLSVPAGELTSVPQALTPLAQAAFRAKAIAELSVPTGILSGVIAGELYNRFADIRLPEYLAFFGGRRFVPIMAGLVGLVLAAALGFGWTWLDQGVKAVSFGIARSGDLGLFAYGALNRLLIVSGLHHILNSVVWFILGDYKGATGDLHRFFAGDPTAGDFMTGFFPVMMFGLPAACLAIYHTARPERRKAVGGMLGSMALTAWLTGITEPIEFSFMFLAPLLYALHAVLTGAAMVLMHVLKVKLGFGFSAGLFDYLLNYNKATRPLLLWPVGLAYAAVYYGIFRWAIVRFDLKTPGRELDDVAVAPADTGDPAERGAAFVAALGGGSNLASVDACMTRLRLVLVRPGKVDDAALKALGARGTVRPSATTLQVVLGPHADQVAQDIREALHRRQDAGPPPARPVPSPAESAPATVVAVASAQDRVLAQRIAETLGGAANLHELDVRSTRIRATLHRGDKLDAVALDRLPLRGVVRPAPEVLHLVIGPSAGGVGAALRELSIDA